MNFQTALILTYILTMFVPHAQGIFNLWKKKSPQLPDSFNDNLRVVSAVRKAVIKTADKNFRSKFHTFPWSISNKNLEPSHTKDVPKEPNIFNRFANFLNKKTQSIQRPGFVNSMKHIQKSIFKGDPPQTLPSFTTEKKTSEGKVLANLNAQTKKHQKLKQQTSSSDPNSSEISVKPQKEKESLLKTSFQEPTSEPESQSPEDDRINKLRNLWQMLNNLSTETTRSEEIHNLELGFGTELSDNRKTVSFNPQSTSESVPTVVFETRKDVGKENLRQKQKVHLPGEQKNKLTAIPSSHSYQNNDAEHGSEIEQKLHAIFVPNIAISAEITEPQTIAEAIFSSNLGETNLVKHQSANIKYVSTIHRKNSERYEKEKPENPFSVENDAQSLQKKLKNHFRNKEIQTVSSHTESKPIQKYSPLKNKVPSDFKGDEEKYFSESSELTSHQHFDKRRPPFEAEPQSLSETELSDKVMKSPDDQQRNQKPILNSKLSQANPLNIKHEIKEPTKDVIDSRPKLRVRGKTPVDDRNKIKNSGQSHKQIAEKHQNKNKLKSTTIPNSSKAPLLDNAGPAYLNSLQRLFSHSYLDPGFQKKSNAENKIFVTCIFFLCFESDKNILPSSFYKKK